MHSLSLSLTFATTDHDIVIWLGILYYYTRQHSFYTQFYPCMAIFQLAMACNTCYTCQEIILRKNIWTCRNFDLAFKLSRLRPFEPCTSLYKLQKVVCRFADGLTLSYTVHGPGISSCPHTDPLNARCTRRSPSPPDFRAEHPVWRGGRGSWLWHGETWRSCRKKSGQSNLYLSSVNCMSEGPCGC